MAATPWGELLVNDAHVHFFSHSFYSGLAKQRKLDRAEALSQLIPWEIPAADPNGLAERWIVEVDRHGLRHVVLIASAPGDEQSVAAAVAAHPGRFFGYFMLDPLQPDALERVQAAA